MNKLNNLFPIYDKVFKVKESYQQNINSLTEEELTGLQQHSFFLDRVHEEMKGCNNEPDISSFNKNLEVIQHKGQGFKDLYCSVFKKDSVETKSYFTDVLFEKSQVTSAEFNPIWIKLAEKSENNVWSKIHNCMYEDTNTLKLQSVKSLVKGLSLKDIDSYDRTEEAVFYIADLVTDIWTSIDFTQLLTLCKTNEKFVFIVLYPYFFKVLGKIVWPTLLAHFHFVSNSFTVFLQKISDFLKKGSNLSHTFRTISVKKPIKYAVGLGSFGLFASYQGLFARKTASILLSNKSLYSGLNGPVGLGINYFRTEGSKLVYEVAKTISTFSSAAIAGALEHKQNSLSSNNLKN